MIRYGSIDELRLVAGHPALDFTNTVVARTDRWGPDLLRSYEDLLDWAVLADILSPTRAKKLAQKKQSSRKKAEAALRNAKNLREAIHAVFSTHVAGYEAPPNALAKLQKAAQRARAASALHPEPGQITWRVSDETNLNTVTHLVAEAATDLLSQPEKLHRVRECPGENCGWLFLDTSRAGRRKWCSDEDCGTLARVRRHRSRKATKTSDREGSA